MNKEIRQALEDLKRYIDVQPPGTLRYCGKDVRELEGYQRASRLLSLGNVPAHGAEVAERRNVMRVRVVPVVLVDGIERTDVEIQADELLLDIGPSGNFVLLDIRLKLANQNLERGVGSKLSRPIPATGI